ncbi:aquaporin TIP1-2 isoform X1 [Physcomitrium patens]|uniref:Uncharacterized protein n=1 Tax=Physcomitrium patens TaxID=3218 RepID=A0A7I4A7H2_PHYPA|nr:aquaporin TIP1-2-like isoform X1 [Physcomitrium patens]|eukprot:XP_024389627.1 aquaporin TIP1-2-like isoform X1 [Physcomitrella patens]
MGHSQAADVVVYQHTASGDHLARCSAPGTPTLDEDRGTCKIPEPISAISASKFSSEVLHRAVLRDLQNPEVWRAGVFECVASFAATFVGILCTISTLEAEFSHPVAVIACLQGLVLSLCIFAAAPATGGHVNPCITWTEMLTGHISPVRGVLYIIGQILGSIVGSFMAKIVVGNALATQYNLGGCYLQSRVSATSGMMGLGTGRALVLEIVLAFFVLFISYSVALDPPRLPRTGYTLAPFMIGGIVGLCIFAGAGLFSGYGGAGINPGRCIGPAVVLGGSMWTGHWVFWVGPGLSGALMAALYRNIPPTHIQVYKLRKEARKGLVGGRKNKPFFAKVNNLRLACGNEKDGERIRSDSSEDQSSSHHRGKPLTYGRDHAV